MFLWTCLHLWRANRSDVQRHMSVLMWLYTDVHPLHAKWVHLQAAGQKEQVSNLAHVCIPHATNSKVGWLPPQTSAVRKGWHRNAHSPEGEEDRCEQEFPHTHTPPVCHGGASSASPNAGRRSGGVCSYPAIWKQTPTSYSKAEGG